MTLTELYGKRNQAWERAKEILERAEAEDRAMSQEEENSWQKANDEMDALDKRIQVQQRMALTEHNADPNVLREDGPKAGGPAGGVGGEQRATSDEYRAAFNAYLREGRIGMDRDQLRILERGFVHADGVEQRALSAFGGAAGGFTAPDNMAQWAERALLFFGGMREVAQVITTENGNDLPFITGNDTTNTGELLAESAAATEQDTTFGLRTLRAHYYSSKYIYVPWELLQDTTINLEQYLGEILGERIGRITNTHFTTGAGGNMPTGISVDSVLGVTAAAVGAVTWDELIDLIHSVDRAYRTTGCRWMFNDLTLRELRQLKDGNGQPIFQPGWNQEAPDTVLGFPYTINNDVPTMATGVIAIYFGRLSSYKIRDVRGFQLLRLEELRALNRQVVFVGFSRHDGMLLDAGGNPVKHILMA